MGSNVDALIAAGIHPPQVEDPSAVALRGQQMLDMQQQRAYRGQLAQLAGIQTQKAQQELQDGQIIRTEVPKMMQDPQYQTNGAPDFDKILSSSDLLSKVSWNTANTLRTTMLGQQKERAQAEEAHARALQATAATDEEKRKAALDFQDHFANWAQDVLESSNGDLSAALPTLHARLMLERSQPGASAAQLAQIDQMDRDLVQNPSSALDHLQQAAGMLSQAGREARAKTKEQTSKTAQERFNQGVQQLRAAAGEDGSVSADDAARIGKQFFELNLPSGALTADFVERKTESTIPADKLAEYYQTKSGAKLPLDQVAFRNKLNEATTALHRPPIDFTKPLQGQLPSDVIDWALKKAKEATEPGDVAALRQQNLLNAQLRADDLRKQQEFGRGGVASMMQSPDIFYDGGFSGPEKAQLGTAWTAQTGLPIPKKLTTDMQNQEAAAQLAMTRLQRIRQLTADPELQPVLGAVMGKIDNLQAKAGTDVGLTDSQARKAQQLRSDLQYFLLGEGKAMVGGRLGGYILDTLKETSPRIGEAIPRLQGAMDSAEQNARDVLTRNEQYRFGGKMRPGFQAGYTSPNQAASPAAPPIPRQLSQSDVGKTYTSKDGRRIKITGVNPKDPTQFKGSFVQ